jgi:hypothetical protein
MVVVAHWVDGVGTCPSGTLVQVPTLPVTEHDLQVPVQAELQQTPPTQNAELHSAFAPQVAPSGFLPQLMLTHEFGDTQSVLVVQVVAQALLDPQTNGSHGEAVPGLQRPEPSQVPAEVSVEPVQEGAWHWVPATYCRQAPAPLHLPSSPQLEAAAIGHWLAVTGAWLMGMGVQVPSVPARLQATQAASQPVLQQ